MRSDVFVQQKGNPHLKSAVRHHAYIEILLNKKLKIMPQYIFTKDGIGEVYDDGQWLVTRTFENMNLREYSLHASHEQQAGAHFRLNNKMILYRHEALRAGIGNALNGWVLQSEADYYHSGALLGIRLGYYRNMRKNLLWQGYQMSDKDYWCLSAQKKLWQGRVFATLSYIPPLAAGVRYARVKEINAPSYKEKSVTHLETYNQMLLLKVSLRLGQGSVKPSKAPTDSRTNERE
jgi:hypothetical protein